MGEAAGSFFFLSFPCVSGALTGAFAAGPGGATRSEGIGAFFCGLTRVSGAVSRFGTSIGAFVVGGGVGRSTLSFGFFTRAALSELGVIAFVVGAEVTGPLSLFFFSGGGVAPSVIPVGGGVLVGRGVTD